MHGISIKNRQYNIVYKILLCFYIFIIIKVVLCSLIYCHK
ncbi:hypothetical protein, partial [Plasmodium yoelii yoelii]